MDVSAKIGKDGVVHTAKYDFGDNVAAAVEKFGEEVVFANFRSSCVVALQGYIRGLIKQNKTAEEIQAEVRKWKPGVRTPGKSAAEKAKEQLMKMDPAQRAALLAEIAKAG